MYVYDVTYLCNLPYLSCVAECGNFDTEGDVFLKLRETVLCLNLTNSPGAWTPTEYLWCLDLTKQFLCLNLAK